MAIHPVTNDQEYEAALAAIDRLWSSDDPAERAEREALTILVDAYEVKRWPVRDQLDPIDMLRHAMSPDVGHSRDDLVDVIGSADGVTQVLARRRSLTLEIIRKIAARWNIPIEALTGAYPLGNRSSEMDIEAEDASGKAAGPVLGRRSGASAA